MRPSYTYTTEWLIIEVLLNISGTQNIELGASRVVVKDAWFEHVVGSHKNTLRSHCVHTVTISHSDHSETMETVWLVCDLIMVGPHRKHTEITLCSHGDHFTLWPLPDYENCVNGVWFEHGWFTHKHTEITLCSHGDQFTLWPLLVGPHRKHTEITVSTQWPFHIVTISDFGNCVNDAWFEHVVGSFT